MKTKEACCRHCGKPFLATKSSLGFWKEYCSARCSRLHYAERQTKLTKSPLYRPLPYSARTALKIVR
jgi:hypothetical protein